jgi:hypothetical protein
MKNEPDCYKLENELEPAQRVHFHILVQARQDYLTALSLEYVDQFGNVRKENFRYKGKGTKLIGGFSTPMTISSLHDLCNYWKSNAPSISFDILGIKYFETSDVLIKLNSALRFRKAKPSKLPLDEL